MMIRADASSLTGKGLGEGVARAALEAQDRYGAACNGHGDKPIDKPEAGPPARASQTRL
jgi:hypothetical protein